MAREKEAEVENMDGGVSGPLSLVDVQWRDEQAETSNCCCMIALLMK